MRRAQFLVREREFEAVSKPLAYRGKKVARYGRWRTVARTSDLAEARRIRDERTAGLFQRVVTYRGQTVVDEAGRDHA